MYYNISFLIKINQLYISDWLISDLIPKKYQKFEFKNFCDHIFKRSKLTQKNKILLNIVDQVQTQWSMNPCLLPTLSNHQFFLHLGKLSGRELNYGQIRTKKEIVSVGELLFSSSRITACEKDALSSSVFTRDLRRDISDIISHRISMISWPADYSVGYADIPSIPGRLAISHENHIGINTRRPK